MEEVVGQILENLELVSKLREAGHSQLVDLLMNAPEGVFTKKGRLNKSGACRVLGWKPKQLEDGLADMRDTLYEEFPDQSD